MTTRSELVQKAKKLGIKNIAKKNMTILIKQIAQKQKQQSFKQSQKSSTKDSQKTKQASKKPTSSKVTVTFKQNTIYNSFRIVNELLDSKSPNQSVCVVQYFAGYSDSFYPTQICILDEKRVLKEFKNFNKHYAPKSTKEEKDTDIDFVYIEKDDIIALKFTHEDNKIMSEFVIYGNCKSLKDQLVKIVKKADLGKGHGQEFLYKGF